MIEGKALRRIDINSSDGAVYVADVILSHCYACTISWNKEPIIHRDYKEKIRLIENFSYYQVEEVSNTKGRILGKKSKEFHNLLSDFLKGIKDKKVTTQALEYRKNKLEDVTKEINKLINKE